ncbi:MAG TPA: SRPBCC domain-containing protein [Devosia sp.]
MKKVVELEKTIRAPRTAVWKAMTAPKSALFPDAKVKTEWQVGNPIRISGTWQGKSYRDSGEVVAVEPEEKLEFTHWTGTGERPDDYHTVSYALAGDGDVTTVTLTQYGHGAKEIDEATREEFRTTWKALLAHLKQIAEAG